MTRETELRAMRASKLRATIAGRQGKSTEPMSNDLRQRHYNWTNLIHRGTALVTIRDGIFKFGPKTPRQLRRIRKHENRAKGRQ